MVSKVYRKYIVVSLRLIGILILFTAFVLSAWTKEYIWAFSLASALVFEISKLIRLPATK